MTHATITSLPAETLHLIFRHSCLHCCHGSIEGPGSYFRSPEHRHRPQQQARERSWTWPATASRWCARAWRRGASGASRSRSSTTSSRLGTATRGGRPRRPGTGGSRPSCGRWGGGLTSRPRRGGCRCTRGSWRRRSSTVMPRVPLSSGGPWSRAGGYERAAGAAVLSGPSWSWQIPAAYPGEGI